MMMEGTETETEQVLHSLVLFQKATTARVAQAEAKRNYMSWRALGPSAAAILGTIRGEETGSRKARI